MGRIFVRRAIAIQAELRKIHEELTQAKGEFTVQVSVAMSGVASIAIIPALLRKFETKFPRALLKLTENLFHGAKAYNLAGDPQSTRLNSIHSCTHILPSATITKKKRRYTLNHTQKY